VNRVYSSWAGFEVVAASDVDIFLALENCDINWSFSLPNIHNTQPTRAQIYTDKLTELFNNFIRGLRKETIMKYADHMQPHF
jgi:hypothetical protein